METIDNDKKYISQYIVHNEQGIKSWGVKSWSPCLLWETSFPRCQSCWLRVCFFKHGNLWMTYATVCLYSGICWSLPSEVYIVKSSRQPCLWCICFMYGCLVCLLVSMWNIFFYSLLVVNMQSMYFWKYFHFVFTLTTLYLVRHLFKIG